VELSLERFEFMRDILHFAILELTETKGFQPSPEWICSRLWIQVGEVEKAVERLSQFGL
jgi:Domain of unknown function (DUF4423)